MGELGTAVTETRFDLNWHGFFGHRSFSRYNITVKQESLQCKLTGKLYNYRALSLLAIIENLRYIRRHGDVPVPVQDFRLSILSPIKMRIRHATEMNHRVTSIRCVSLYQRRGDRSAI